MKIKAINNVSKFFEVIKECNGRVELITEAGDRLNLKSKLSQLIFLNNVFKEASIEEFEVMCSDPTDVIRLLDYLVRG